MDDYLDTKRRTAMWRLSGLGRRTDLLAGPESLQLAGHFASGALSASTEARHLVWASAQQLDPARHDWLFALPAFYAEFAPPRRLESETSFLYILRDRGLMTADRRAFGSPFNDIAFVFREGLGEAVVRVRPARCDHLEKRRPFYGWIFGIRTSALIPDPHTPAVVDCTTRLTRAINGVPSSEDILAALDGLLSTLPDSRTTEAHRAIVADISKVRDIAASTGVSARTLQRRTRSEAGLPPKSLLNADRFRRAVYEVAIQQDKLSTLANELGFSDQAHLTRDFRRHAGLTPAAFKRAWQGARGIAVRFVQDECPSCRLRVAVFATETDCASPT